MCGIAGGWFRDGIDAEILKGALSKITHRGPDAAGLRIEGPIALGMRRLAILDLDGGEQPTEDASGRCLLTFNGEIYNYRELAQNLRSQGELVSGSGDTAVLPALYARYGTDIAHQLRGMFALAIWDRRHQALHLFRDRFGQKPLFVADLGSRGIAFASELKALLPLMSATGANPQIRDGALYDYLSIGVVPQPDTVYEGVRCVPPGGHLTFRKGEISERRYYLLRPQDHRGRSYQEVLASTRDHLRQAVRVRLRSDVPLGVFLSGGIDSSIVAYEASRLVGSSLRTFTVATPGSLDEAPVARRTARSLGVENTVLPLEVQPRADLDWLVGHYDQPYADSSAIPTLAIARLARQHVKVVLNGDGGDEMFAGYRRHLGAALAPWDLPGRLPDVFGLAMDGAARRFVGRRSAPGFLARLARGAVRPPGARYLVWTTDMLLDADKRNVWKGEPTSPTEERINEVARQHRPGLRRQLLTDHGINLLSDLLVKMDMATMAASLEARSPFMDHEVAELAAALPTTYLLRGGRTKAVLRDAYADALPSEVIHGRKRGFEIPLADWLRNDWRELIEDSVLHPGAAVTGYLDPSFVRAVFREPGFLMERNMPYVQYALLVLELWLREQH